MVYAHEPLFDGKRLYSRLIADSLDELQEFGELLGLQFTWIQYLGTHPYFLVYTTKLKLALTHAGLQYLTLAEFEEYLAPTSDKLAPVSTPKGVPETPVLERNT
jgi:hypothetical protein